MTCCIVYYLTVHIYSIFTPTQGRALIIMGLVRALAPPALVRPWPGAASLSRSPYACRASRAVSHCTLATDAGRGGSRQDGVVVSMPMRAAKWVIECVGHRDACGTFVHRRQQKGAAVGPTLVPQATALSDGGFEGCPGVLRGAASDLRTGRSRGPSGRRAAQRLQAPPSPAVLCCCTVSTEAAVLAAPWPFCTSTLSHSCAELQTRLPAADSH